MKNVRELLLLPHVKIQNANALSSPFTIGFPAMTAWLGAVHALQLKLNKTGFEDVKFIATGVVSHDFDLQTYKGPNDYNYSIINMGFPLTVKGKRSPIIEAPRCHLEISLVIEYTGITENNFDVIKNKIAHLLHTSIRMAGGNISDFKEPEFITVTNDDLGDIQHLNRKIMPGYVLVERRDLMIEAMEQGQDALDALLDYLAVHHSCILNENAENENDFKWLSKRKEKGWIVPIATGFHGLNEPGKAKNQRDLSVPHRFAESIVTLGEFKMSYKTKSLNEILWSYCTKPESNLYLCSQQTL